MRLMVVHRSDKLDRENGALLRALEHHFELTTVLVDGRPPRRADELVGIESVDVCLWRVRFRDLPEAPPFDWQGWDGLRVLQDWDAANNFWSWSHTRLRGAYSTELRRHGFDLVVCSSTQTAERFAAEGLPAAVVFKAYDHHSLHPLGGPRTGLGTFGHRYPARRAAEGALARAGLGAERFAAPFEELNRELNRFEAVLVCNMTGLPRRGGAWLERLRPGAGVRGMAPGPEVMLKSFEVAGSGAALLTDGSADLAELGFVHGETALVYRDLDELVEVWRRWSGDHEGLAAVGAAGAALVQARHTWAHRAAELEAVLAAASAAR